jgi:hypothetical protein
MKMYSKSRERDLFISVDFRLCLSSRQDLLRSKLQKPPKGYRNPLEASFYLSLLEMFFHRSSRRLVVIFSGD